jgi:hypothetical protein
VREASHSIDLAASRDGHKRAECNDCNEAARLAAVAKNSLMNGHFPRVIALLDTVIRHAVRRAFQESRQDEDPSENIAN